jgi:hypothetical protein
MKKFIKTYITLLWLSFEYNITTLPSHLNNFFGSLLDFICYTIIILCWPLVFVIKPIILFFILIFKIHKHKLAHFNVDREWENITNRLLKFEQKLLK